MILFPATDILGGKVVRLKRGEFDKVTVYGDDPTKTALSFYADGARYLHAVDLDGARGSGDNFDTISRVIEKSGMKVQVGGGIRDGHTVEKYLSAGAFRVILGTAAATDEAFLKEMLTRYGDKIAVGVDIKDGFVAVRGWQDTLPVSLDSYCKKLCALGCRTVICTDISKDGLLQGTNRQLYADMISAYSMDIIASGGVTSLDDIKHLSGIGIYGAILGAALYEKRISLPDALAVCGEVKPQ